MKIGEAFDVTVQPNGIPNSYFYRVVNVTETNTGTLDIELNAQGMGIWLARSSAA